MELLKCCVLSGACSCDFSALRSIHIGLFIDNIERWKLSSQIAVFLVVICRQTKGLVNPLNWVKNSTNFSTIIDCFSLFKHTLYYCACHRVLNMLETPNLALRFGLRPTTVSYTKMVSNNWLVSTAVRKYFFRH